MHSILDVTDVRVLFSVGDSILPADAAEIPFDFGFPGLRLATKDGGIKADVAWQIDVGFGLSLEEGFYIVTDADDPNDAGDGEISLAVTVDTPDLSADIAFLGVEIDSDNSDTAKPALRADGVTARQDAELSLTLEIDLPDDGSGKLGLSNLLDVDPVDFLPELQATVDLYWRLQTAPEFGGASAGDGTLPTLLATLDVTWDATLSASGFSSSGLAVAFEDVQLDLGSFLEDFLGPIIAEVQKYTKPLQPIIDIVSTPIPGISQLAEFVGEDPITMLTLFEAISGNDLTLVKTILDLITFANALPTGNGGLGAIDIGRFEINADKFLDSELPANQKGDLISFSAPEPGGIAGAIGDLNSSFDGFKDAFTANMSSSSAPESEEPGFSFPAFEDFSNLFNLLVGEDVTLIRWASGPLKAEFGYSQSFGPIAVGPIPVSVVISGSASIEGRIAVGYDTKGVRQLVQMLTDDDPSNDSFLSGFGFLFNGLFLDDLNAAGQDVPEIRLVVEFAAGAAIDLVIVSAGVEGGVRATLDLNLHDGGFFDNDPNTPGLQAPPENLDGKLRLDEIASFIFNNPLCLFDVSGKLEAFIRIFVEIDLFLFSKRFEFTVINITLLELENITAELCEPPDPVLATAIGDGVLRLNMGPNADARGFAPDEPSEKFFIRQLDSDTVQVSAFGYDQTFDGVTKVVGDAGSNFADPGNDKDTIRFEPGTIQSVASPTARSSPPRSRSPCPPRSVAGVTTTRSPAVKVSTASSVTARRTGPVAATVGPAGPPKRRPTVPTRSAASVETTSCGGPAAPTSCSATTATT